VKYDAALSKLFFTAELHQKTVQARRPQEGAVSARVGTLSVAPSSLFHITHQILERKSLLLRF